VGHTFTWYLRVDTVTGVARVEQHDLGVGDVAADVLEPGETGSKVWASFYLPNGEAILLPSDNDPISTPQPPFLVGAIGPKQPLAVGAWEFDLLDVLARLDDEFGEGAPTFRKFWEHARFLDADKNLPFCELMSLPDHMVDGGPPFEAFVVHSRDPNAP